MFHNWQCMVLFFLFLFSIYSGIIGVDESRGKVRGAAAQKYPVPADTAIHLA